MKWFFALITVVSFGYPAFGYAQFFGGSDISITSQPSYPEPGERVTLTLDAYSFDTVGSEVTWKINNAIEESATGENSMTYTTGTLGKLENVTVSITLRDGNTYTASKTIIPSRTNLTIEADTHTPYFYQGRKEPSIGSTIRAISIPETNLDYKTTDYVYRWEIDDNVQFGGPIKGRNYVSFEPSFGKEVKIRVDVMDPATGQVVASSLEYIPFVEPEIQFYKESLLHGESHIAMKDSYNLIEEEISVIAEPFFMSNSILISPRLIWKVNGESIENPNEDPYKITLRKTGGSGVADIFFSVRNTKALTQYAENSLNVSF